MPGRQPLTVASIVARIKPAKAVFMGSAAANSTKKTSPSLKSQPQPHKEESFESSSSAALLKNKAKQDLSSQKQAPVKNKNSHPAKYPRGQPHPPSRPREASQRVAKKKNRNKNNNNNNMNPQELPNSGHNGQAGVRKFQLAKEELRRDELQCTGKAAQALQEYRKHFVDLVKQAIPKPDMKGWKALNSKWISTPRPHGPLKGVPIGVRLYGKGEMAIVGVHCQIPKGIDGGKMGLVPCYAVCVSGDYADDEDTANDHSVIWYTGESRNRNKKTKAITEDQTDSTPENASLIRSWHSGTPIRLIRRLEGKDPFYIYEGLYKCTDYTYNRGRGIPFKVFRFKLEKMSDDEQINQS